MSTIMIKDRGGIVIITRIQLELKMLRNTSFFKIQGHSLDLILVLESILT